MVNDFQQCEYCRHTLLVSRKQQHICMVEDAFVLLKGKTQGRDRHIMLSKTFKISGFLMGLLFTLTSKANAQINLNQGAMLTPAVNANFDQRVNNQIPLNLTFTRSNGENVTLSQFINGKLPSILIMPFYKCKAGSVQELKGVANLLNSMHMRAGKDYQVLTVSINPEENSAIASSTKQMYVAMLKNKGDAGYWHFLTGSEPNITALAVAVGMHYLQNLKKQQFDHPTGILLIEPTGKIYRYVFGTSYDTAALETDIRAAAAGDKGTYVEQAYTYCSVFDIHNGPINSIVNKILIFSGCATVLILVFYVGSSLYMEKKHPKLANSK